MEAWDSFGTRGYNAVRSLLTSVVIGSLELMFACRNSSLATLGVYLHCNLTMWTFLQCIGIVQSVIENIQTGYLVILGMIIGDFNTDPNC